MAKAWMPFYCGDFLADTMHLSCTERGIYISLIIHCWQHGSIPRDPGRLARITACDSRLWWQYEKTVLQFFDVVDASTMQHKRVSTELHRCAEISNKRKAAAQQMLSKRSANAEQMLTQSQSQSQSHKNKKEDTANAVSSPTKYIFESGVIRLGEKDFDKWKRAFGHLDLEAELLALTEWAAAQPKWFFAVSGALAKRNRQAKASKEGNGAQTDRERRKSDSERALNHLRERVRSAASGNVGNSVVRFLPQPGAGSQPGSISNGSDRIVHELPGADRSGSDKSSSGNAG